MNVSVELLFSFLLTVVCSCQNSRDTRIEDAYFTDKELEQSSENEVVQEETDICIPKEHFIAIEQTDVSVGLPILKTTIPSQILKRTSYDLSYNKSLLIPNWVAWHLTAEHADGDIPRDNAYYEDMDVPLPRATSEDYHGSGWSRGHMCPAGDNKWDTEAMKESNLLTNICPQHASLNSGLWNVIEKDCRKWAKRYGDLYIVCGPVLLNKKHETIGVNKVVVPEAFFKVILRMNPHPTAIGFIIRNNEGKKKKDQFFNTIDDVERITGIDFFSALPDSIEDKVEAFSNICDWR
jgi:endonuclease G